jgi:hypothetical protein
LFNNTRAVSGSTSRMTPSSFFKRINDTFENQWLIFQKKNILEEMIGDFGTHGVVEIVVLLGLVGQPTQGTVAGVKTVVGQKSKNRKTKLFNNYSDWMFKKR